MFPHILHEVNSVELAKKFITFPLTIYANDPNWVRPLDADIEKVFDRKENKYFRNGDCMRWLISDSNGKIKGRIAAFFNNNVSAKEDQPTGGVGFFECVNDIKLAELLFDTAKTWLFKNGMEAMDGPINFGDRDRWWGLLVDGFTPPNYAQNYNPHYYCQLFEEYGFKNYFEQYTFYRLLNTNGLAPEIAAKAERIKEDAAYTFRHITKNKIEKYAEDFRTIYNKAWIKHAGTPEISKVHAQALLKSMKPILDEKLMWFAYYDDQPIAFFIMLPEINQIVQHLNGSLNLYGKIKYFWYKHTGAVTKAFGLIFGVIPSFQAKGVEGAIIMAFGELLEKGRIPYKELELNWIGDFNPSMIKLAEQVGAKITKTHITYRYLFDREKPFKRSKLTN